MRVIGYHCQDNLICNSDQEVCHDNYLEFLLRPKEDAIKVCYNLDWFVARLCYLLGIPEWQLKKFWGSSSLYWQGWQIFFVPHRYLGFKYGKHWGEANMSDIFQYDPTLPFDIDPLDAAKKAQEIGEQVYDALRRLELNPKTLSSPVSCFQKEVLSTLDLPTLDDIPEEVRLYAHECLHGGWQEIFRQGSFDAFDWDLVSAYPAHTATLIDHRFGEWFKSDKFYPQLPYGFCRGTVRIESGFSPVCYTVNDNQYTPTGEWDTTLTSKQIKQLYDYDLGRFKIECFSPDTDVWTEHGIKNICNVSTGDNVYSINPIDLSVTLKPVVAIQRYPYDGDIYHLHNKKVDFVVTPEHEFLLQKSMRTGFAKFKVKSVVADYGISDWRFPKYKAICGLKLPTISLWDYVANDNIIVAKHEKVHRRRRCSRVLSSNPAFKQRVTPYSYVAVKSAIDNPEMFENNTIYTLSVKTSMWNSHYLPWKYDTNDLLQLIGWYVSEGHLVKDTHGDRLKPSYGVGITNNDTSQIEWLLMRMGIYHKHPKAANKAKSVHFYSEMLYNFFKNECGEGSANKRLPRWVFTLDHSHLVHLYNTLMAGDGTGITRINKNNATKTPGYFTISKQLADDVRQLCIHLGYKTSVHIAKKGNESILKGRVVETKHDSYGIYVQNSQEHFTSIRTPEDIHTEYYNGDVHCITVKDNHTVLAGRNGRFEFIGQSAWYFKPDKVVMPLEEDIETLFEWKSQLQGMDREVVKRILTAVWGKTQETFHDGEFGKLFNPVWAATIETSTRVQVADFILSNKLQDNLISIAVDGCLLDKKIELSETGDMGTWRLDREAPAFVVSSGVGAIKGKQNKGTFSLNYDWLAEQIAANPDATEYKMQKLTPVTIGNALKNNKLDKLGELEMTERAVFIGIENKRFYKDAPVNGGDLYKQYPSEPLDVSCLQKIVLDDTSEIE